MSRDELNEVSLDKDGPKKKKMTVEKFFQQFNTLDMNMIPLQKIIQEEKGENWTLEEVYHFASYPGMKVMEELEVKNPEEVYARWVKYVNEYEHGAKLYEGFETVFEKFDGKIIQAIVSSKMVAQYQIDVVEKGIDKSIKICEICGKPKNSL